MGYLASLFPSRPAPGTPGDPGLFGPGSLAWSIGRERALLAAGPAALLLQVAHPLVAAGVAGHSDFENDPMRRLRGTLDATLSVGFGDSAQVARAAERVARRHAPVQGRLAEAAGRFPAGTGYRADDPELARWVHATLVWSAMEFYDLFVAPLGSGEQDAYTAEMTRFGRLFGVPDPLLPRSSAELQRYVADMAEVLHVGPQARAIAGQVLDGAGTGLPRPMAAAARALATVLAAGLLPARVREAYALPWRRRERAAFATVRAATRVGVRLLPGRVRYFPHYGAAVRRLAPPG